MFQVGNCHTQIKNKKKTYIIALNFYEWVGCGLCIILSSMEMAFPIQNFNSESVCVISTTDGTQPY